MTIEEFKDITIAYMRRTGEYGFQNTILMERFKTYLAQNDLLNHNSIILDIALDNPANTDMDKLRYDVGMVYMLYLKFPIQSRMLLLFGIIYSY